MNDVRILIVEDEPPIASDLAAHLAYLGYEVCGICSDALEAMEAIAAKRPDLLLLDISLGHGADGIQLAQQVNKSHRIPFIFVTSRTDQETLDRVKAVRPAGFIIKPFEVDDLRTQITIALARFAAHMEVTHAPTEPQLSGFVIADSIFIRDKGKLVKVPVADIHYAEADDNYVTLHTPARRYVIISTLAAVEEKLASPDHLRVHRSYLVDLRKVTSLEEGYVHVGTTALPVGKTYREGLMARIRTL